MDTGKSTVPCIKLVWLFVYSLFNVCYKFLHAYCAHSSGSSGNGKALNLFRSHLTWTYTVHVVSWKDRKLEKSPTMDAADDGLGPL